jgi:hypothetical protein
MALQWRDYEVQRTRDGRRNRHHSNQQQSAATCGRRAHAVAPGAEGVPGRLGSDGDRESLYHRAILWTPRAGKTVPGRIVTGP